LLADVKVQDYAWMNINMLLGMATIDGNCFKECEDALVIYSVKIYIFVTKFIEIDL